MNELVSLKFVLSTQSYATVGVMLVLPTHAACSSSWSDGSAANIIEMRDDLGLDVPTKC
jgi:hypothetical protein